MATSKLDEAEIFNVARRSESCEARRRYVDEACCGDTQLRARVEALLRVHEQDFSFLESPADGLPSAIEEEIGEGPGAVIGPYRLLEQIGEGGFGVVFRAEQEQPVRRQVALKVIKPGMDTRQVVARFEAERQALALMDHPNIARVLDAGSTSGFGGRGPWARVAKAGVSAIDPGQCAQQTLQVPLYPGPLAFASGTDRPYFVMELVKGIPITRYCDERRLTPQERLALFVPICQAVEHAHQKGIIHRDLKPSNVLVAAYDGRPVPKVIDFGVAKALGQPLTQRTLVTGHGDIIGTLEYMSPEQTQVVAVDVDTRADIYSLGVLLYEVLTGTTPLTKERLREMSVVEALRIIREEDPPRPSTRLRNDEGGRMKDESKRTGWRRLWQVSSFILPPSSFQEVDWIVMKALDKDRSRRYQTANALGRDLERYLHDQPVEACPPRKFYQLGKFARRHRRLLLALAAFIILLLVAAGVSTWLAIRATMAEWQAQENERHALAERDAKEKALQREADQRQQAVAEKGRADDEAAIARAVNQFVEDLLGQADIGNQPAGAERDRNISVRQLLDRAAEGIADRFKGQERTEAGICFTLGVAYRALGEYAAAQTHLERSYDLRKQALGPAHADTLNTMNALALLRCDRGQYAEAEALFTEALATSRASLGADHMNTLQTINNLAALYRDRSRYQEAETLLKQGLEGYRRKLGDAHRFTLLSMNNLATLYRDLGRNNEAESLLQQAVAGSTATLGKDHPNTLTTRHNLALLYANCGRYQEAERLYQEVLDARRAKLGDHHPSTLASVNALGALYLQLGRRPEAQALLEQALNDRRATLGPNHPGTLESMGNVALLYRDLRRFDEAESLFQSLLTAQRGELGTAHASTLMTVFNLALLYGDCGRFAEAEPLFLEAIAGAKKTLGPAHWQTQRFIDTFADHCKKQGKCSLAEQELRELAEVIREKDGADSLTYAGRLCALARNLLEQSKYVEAEAMARGYWTIRASKQPNAWATYYAEYLLGSALLGQTRYAEAEPYLLEAYQGMKEREAQFPQSAKSFLTSGIERLVQLYDACGQPDKAATWRRQLEAEKERPKK